MKIATWNVNSIRMRLGRILGWVEQHQPDVLCLQELKCTSEQFPHAELERLGYRSEVYGQKSYNGVALVSKLPVVDVQRGMGDDDPQARIIAASVAGLRVVSVYAPNGQSPHSEAYQYKLTWYQRLQRWLGASSGGLPLVVCGDFNVAPEDIDVWSVPLFAGQTLFSEPEKAALKSLVTGLSLVDLFRLKHPNEPGRFSWWDYRLSAFKKNQGLRIDHLLASPAVAEKCLECDIDAQARGGDQPSDHAPVWATVS